ncbi:MAG: demethylmenaquinone methyltransferase [Actinomycetota bacterium]|nr:demethylmenaquinone methyltransferase [Actinomycetota bacterium]
MTRASLAKRPEEVAAMFDAVAARYDVTNDLLSLGLDRRWRRETADAVAAAAGDRVLDLAAGTGTSAIPFHDAGALAVACDFSPGMLRAGHQRRPQLAFVAGDALRLPFADAVFDAVTCSFGLRNVTDPDAALRELRRVTRPGGRLVLCEFAKPVQPVLRTLYAGYLARAVPVLARLSSSPDAYHYLAESILAWPDQPALAARVHAAGWREVAWRNLTTGIVALHRGIRTP